MAQSLPPAAVDLGSMAAVAYRQDWMLSQEWLVSWHPPGQEPPGRNHGSCGICVTGDDQLVLIGHDGMVWGYPGGRPEGNETYEETLRREMDEEACVEVLEARLLGFARSECTRGPEAGLVLVRAYWRALVRVLPWEPRFEIPLRRLVPTSAVLDHLHERTEAETRIVLRALAEAGITAARRG